MLNYNDYMIKNKEDYKKYILLDAWANSKNNKGLIDIIKGVFFPDYTWNFIKLLRKAEYHKNQNGVLNKISYIYYYYKFRRLSLKLGFSIHLNVFGPGISIPHYGTIVVNANAQIGKNCRIHASVNIG